MIHDEIKTMGDIVCPFCFINLEDSDEKPQDRLAKYDLCCECQDIINNNGMFVCRSCGIVQGYDSSTEYIDFYESKDRIRRKSVYHRKYHINVLTDLSSKYRITFSVEQNNKIMRIFSVVDKILPQINGERKRMISINFILRKVLKMMGLPFNKIPISKSKKTLASYERYWTLIISLVGDKIKDIIQ